MPDAVLLIELNPTIPHTHALNANLMLAHAQLRREADRDKGLVYQLSVHLLGWLVPPIVLSLGKPKSPSLASWTAGSACVQTSPSGQQSGWRRPAVWHFGCQKR
jgi:hypothetical protein